MTLQVRMGYVSHGSVLQALCWAGQLRDALAWLRDSVPAHNLRSVMFNIILTGCLTTGKRKTHVSAT